MEGYKFLEIFHEYGICAKIRLETGYCKSKHVEVL